MSLAVSRREFVSFCAGSFALSVGLRPCSSLGDVDAVSDVVAHITDPDIRAGVAAAIEKNLLAAISERLYPGQFNITADAGAYGSDSTWPGLDSWQMAGAYLLLGKTRLVLDYFDFVRA